MEQLGCKINLLAAVAHIFWPAITPTLTLIVSRCSSSLPNYHLASGESFDMKPKQLEP